MIVALTVPVTQARRSPDVTVIPVPVTVTVPSRSPCAATSHRRSRLRGMTHDLTIRRHTPGRLNSDNMTRSPTVPSESHWQARRCRLRAESNSEDSEKHDPVGPGSGRRAAQCFRLTEVGRAREPEPTRRPGPARRPGPRAVNG
jgi:hypothetical protein